MRRGPTCRTTSVLALGMLAALAHADLTANFDDRREGEWFDAFVNGGIRFHDVTTHSGGYTNFTIEDASGGFLGSGLTPPNVLGFGGYVPGPGVAFGGIAGFWYTADLPATTAGLDVWAFQADLGVNTVSLRGYLGGSLVEVVSFSFNAPSVPLHQRLDLAVGTYDHFELSSSGQAILGDSCLVVDNVTVAAVPEPAGLAVLGASALALVRRRPR